MDSKFVRMELSRVHDKFVWTSVAELITKEVIQDVTSLFSTRPLLVLKAIKNDVVMKLTGATYPLLHLEEEE